MKKIVHDHGLDVHKETIAVSIAPGDAREVRRYGEDHRRPVPLLLWTGHGNSHFCRNESLCPPGTKLSPVPTLVFHVAGAVHRNLCVGVGIGIGIEAGTTRGHPSTLSEAGGSLNRRGVFSDADADPDADRGRGLVTALGLLELVMALEVSAGSLFLRSFVVHPRNSRKPMASAFSLGTKLSPVPPLVFHVAGAAGRSLGVGVGIGIGIETGTARGHPSTLSEAGGSLNRRGVFSDADADTDPDADRGRGLVTALGLLDLVMAKGVSHYVGRRDSLVP